jgi:hypothetical protein
MKGHCMSSPLRVVIVGGVAAGPKIASKVIRLCPEAEVTIVEKGKLLSYAGRGLPYYVSGVVKEQTEPMNYVSYDPSGKFIVAPDQGNTISVWDTVPCSLPWPSRACGSVSSSSPCGRTWTSTTT